MTRHFCLKLLAIAVSACAAAGCSTESNHNYGDFTPSATSPTPTTGDDDATQIGDDDASQTGDDDASQAGDDDASQAGDDDASQAGDDDASEAGDDDSTGSSSPKTATIYDLRKGKYPSGTRVILNEAEPITEWSQPHAPPTDYDSSKYVAYDFLVNEEDPTEFGGIVVEMVYPRDTQPVLVITPGDLATITGTFRFDERLPFPVVMVESESDISVSISGATVPAPVSIDACDVAGADQYFAMRVAVSDVTVDAKAGTGFEYNDCLMVSADLFFPSGTSPSFQTGQLFDTVIGVPYFPTSSSYPSFALELTSADDLIFTSGVLGGGSER